MEDKCVLYPLLFLNGAPMSFFVVPLPPSDVYYCLVLDFWDYVWWGSGGISWVGYLLGFGFPQVRLPEEVHTCAVFPLGPMYADLVRRHPGSPYAAVSGAHQSGYNTTLDVPARLRVRLLPLGGQATD